MIPSEPPNCGENASSRTNAAVATAAAGAFQCTDNESKQIAEKSWIAKIAAATTPSPPPPPPPPPSQIYFARSHSAEIVSYHMFYP